MKKTIIPLFLTVFITLNAVSAKPAAGQLLNGDFEDWMGDNPDDWTILGSVSVEDETTEKYQGSHSLKLTIPAFSNIEVYQYLVGFTEGNTLSVVAYVLDNNDIDIYLGFIWLLNDISFIVIKASGSVTSVDNPNWQQLSWSQDCPRSQDGVANVSQVRFYCANTGSGAETVYIDAASVSGPDIVKEYSIPQLVLTASVFMATLVVIKRSKHMN